MPPGRPPGPNVRIRDLCLIPFLLPTLAAALQKQPRDHYTTAAGQHNDDLANAASSAQARYHSALGDSLHHDLNTGQLGHRDTNVNGVSDNNKNKKSNAHQSPLHERALATVSPAESARADPVQWKPASSSASASAVLNSRLPARSLQDWKVEEVILLATVDGRLEARERRTGRSRWVLETGDVVEITRHRENSTLDENGLEIRDPMFIVEPSQDGSIYVLDPELGLQKMPFTVKTLAETSPYASEGLPAVVYTAEKKSTLYYIDAATGNIMKTFSSEGASITKDRCRLVNPLENPLDDSDCETNGTLIIARTQYAVKVADGNSGEPITTIKYFEWAPNNRDNDLRNVYRQPMDRRYVYTGWDGRIQGVQVEQGKLADSKKQAFIQYLDSPVVRVFDIFRPVSDPSGEASLVILPQPVGPPLNEFTALEYDRDAVYVNRTENGNWYALSETRYPSVTDGARAVTHLDAKRFQDNNLAGVYNLPDLDPSLVEGSPPLLIDAPPVNVDYVETREVEVPMLPAVPQTGTAAWQYALIMTIFALIIGGLGIGAYRKDPEAVRRLLLPKPVVADVPVSEPIKVSIDEEPPQTPTFIREDEPAKETIFRHEDREDSPNVHFAEPLHQEGSPEKSEADAPDGEDESKDDVEPKKKKATRGRRAGRKQKEKEAAQAEARAQKNGPLVPRAEQVISVAASESSHVSGPLQINSLVIHTDKIIGQGSCGTIVFEGAFEGRDVAVKRMLSQYYELASQEVSFLQQSDDHPNVVRYFCQQKDDHFLYIAVELCQASLFEVFEADKARNEERRLQLQTLKTSIQQDMTRTLEQLAEGLCHLHSLRIIHRDIKPQNILVAFPKRTQAPGSTRLVISDFGLGKNLPENVSTLVDPTGNAGTSGWKAPELISQPSTDSNHSQRTNGSENGTPGSVSGVKRAADIFSLGCLFFWVLTDGVHPFEDENGWMQLRELNIKRDKKNMDALAHWSDAYEPMQLISSMLAHEPADRPTAQAVLNHPYFWDAKKRLAFLCDCSDHFEREPRGTFEDEYAGDSLHLRVLEDRMEEVIGPRHDFLARLDRVFVDTLGKQRKYSGYRVLDLLRALRNKKNHYEDMPEHVKRLVGPLAGGYLAYWSNKFPRLLMACYEVILECRLEHNDRFKGYLGNGSS